MAATLLELRADIATALASYLGTYTLANGATTPAIAVRAPNDAHAPGTRVAGLEAVLVRDPDTTALRQYANAPSLRTWEVFLVAWDASADLEGAAVALCAAVPGARSETVNVPQGAGPRAQRRITIPTPS